MRLTTAIREFLVAQQADGSRPKTIEWYQWLLKHFVTRVGDVAIDTVTTGQMRKYIVYVRGKYSADTVSAHIRGQHKFWKWCAIEYDMSNPMRNIKYPARSKPRAPKAVATGDIAKLFDAIPADIIGYRDRAMLAFLVDTGARAAGIVSLKVDMIDLDKRQAIVHEKNDESRVVVFSKFTGELFKQWMAVRSNVEPLFYNLRTLEPLTVSGLQQFLQRLKSKAGVAGRVNPHAFRHGFAREYLKAGGDLATLARLLGHKDVSTTALHYAIFTIDELADRHDELSPIRHLLDKETE